MESSMFFDGGVDIARYDQVKYPALEKITEKMLGFFWRPEEIDITKDYKDFMPIQQSSSLSKYYTSNVTVPNASKTGTTMSFAMAPSFTKVEQVILTININASPALTCNQIELSSPSGTKSIVMHAANGFSNSGVLQTSLPGTRFLSNAFYGETPVGTWTLRFLDFCNSLTRTTILTSNTQKLNITGN